jgi:predicted transcriptional regulator of viral defense system
MNKNISQYVNLRFHFALVYDIIYIIMSNINNNLIKLRKKGTFTTKQAYKVGVSSRMLNYYCSAGLITRLGQGIYIFSDKQSFELKSIIKQIIIQVPQGVVGLETALRFYDLTEEADSEIQILVPKNNVPKRKLENTRLYQVNAKLFKVGLIKKDSFKITSIERTIIDLLKFNFPLSKVIKVISMLRHNKVKLNMELLAKYSLMFRTKGKFENLLEAIL